MSKKFIFPIIFTITLMIGVSSIIKKTPQPAPVPQISHRSSAPVPIPASYEIRLSDGNICLFSLDEQGSELEQKILGYIDIHSLQSFQLDKLRTGAKFESREAAAEFIQDLDS